MLHDFHRNSPDGRVGKHPPQGREEDDVETFQYNQASSTLGGMAPIVHRAETQEAFIGEEDGT
jgi:hypothetical protein